MKPKVWIVVLTMVAGSGILIAQQNVPQLISYQGTLSDAQGQPLATADYTLLFRIYDQPTAGAGTLIWGPQIFDGAVATGHGAKIPVVKGYFNVLLGPSDVVGKPIVGAFQNAPNRYVEIQVGATSQPIAPRQQILSSPYAAYSQAAWNGNPPGTVVAFAGTNLTEASIPGYLACSGQAVSRATYKDLFAAIGTFWGPGDGSTTFNVPDYRGYFLRGTDAGAGRDADLSSRFRCVPGSFDTGAGLGSCQNDAFQGHGHSFWLNLAWASNQRGASFPEGILYGRDGGGFAVSPIPMTFIDDGHGAPRPGFETHPKNASVNYIIKY